MKQHKWFWTKLSDFNYSRHPRLKMRKTDKHTFKTKCRVQMLLITTSLNNDKDVMF